MITWKDVIFFTNKGSLKPDKKVIKSDMEWKELLHPDIFKITRKKGTERAFSSDICSLFEPGLYSCVCCQEELFDANQKFNSGTGWPSFTQPIKENAIGYLKDSSFGMVRVEVICNTCDSHLGHVFPDGPAPSGLRYCINSLALIKKD